MLIIKVVDGADGQSIAERLTKLLGQGKLFPDDQGPPFSYSRNDKWQLDRNNNFWLFTESHGFRAMGRYPANEEKLGEFADDLRQLPEVTSVEVRSF